MNSQFRNVAALYKRGVGELSHRQVVMRLYRDTLRSLLSWTMDRDLFLEEAENYRNMFDAEKDADPGRATRLIEEAKAELLKCKHPDPYCIPYMPGGSKFMRNAPPPLEAVYPDGIPEEIASSFVPLHPDGVPYTFRPTNSRVLINNPEKSME